VGRGVPRTGPDDFRRPGRAPLVRPLPRRDL